MAKHDLKGVSLLKTRPYTHKWKRVNKCPNSMTDIWWWWWWWWWVFIRCYFL